MSMELLPGASLDSVVEKASELERMLRGCKIAAAHDVVSEGTYFSEGRGRLHDDQSFDADAAAETSHFPPPSEADSTSLARHWHHLSTYIVGLEKEIEYYKQLVDDRQKQQVHATGPVTVTASPSKENQVPNEKNLEHDSGRQASVAVGHEVRQQKIEHQSQNGASKSGKVFIADGTFWKKLTEGQSSAMLPSSDLSRDHDTCVFNN